jgi:Kef-type K+ transport system membrane component KefB
VFQVFAVRVLPFAPKSEFTFLLILALICAYLTRHLGVYYLVGAFVVGVTAVRMRKRLPELASPRLLIGIDLFASFFVPFYFFKAGLHLETRYFSWRAISLGLAFVVLAVPLRVGLGSLVRRLLLGESLREGLRVGLSLTPTLVFTLVLADILRERYGLGDALYGSLVVFALGTTVLPGLFLRSMPEFAAPEVPRPLSMAPAPGPEMASASPAPDRPDRPDKPSVAESV